MSERPITRIAAYGLVLRQQQILLCRIAAQITPYARFWTLPGGGIEFGEDPADAVVREVREETGLLVRPKAVAGIDSRVIPNEDSTTHSLRIVYFTEVLGGVLSNEVDGSTDLCEWHEIDAAASLALVDLVESGLSFLSADVSRRT